MQRPARPGARIPDRAPLYTPSPSMGEYLRSSPSPSMGEGRGGGDCFDRGGGDRSTSGGGDAEDRSGPGSESGACVAALLPFDRPPSLHSLRRRFVVGFVRGFTGTTQPSDSSRLPQQLRLLDFLSRPGIALATAGGVRSPRFRRDPFIRDVASDPGRATVPCIAAPHMLPSAVATASAPATSRISWLNPTPQMITVYASPWSSPSPTQHSLPSRRYPLPGPDFHRLDPASFAWRTATPSMWNVPTSTFPAAGNGTRRPTRSPMRGKTRTANRSRLPTIARRRPACLRTSMRTSSMTSIGCCFPFM